VTTYKLLRFVDFGVERGHRYRYRVQVVLEDPNHPPVPMGATGPNAAVGPPPASLDPDVEARLKQVAAEEAKTNTRIAHRESKWSEPGPVITVPEPLILAAGEVTTPARDQVVNEARIPAAEPKAKAMVVVLDEQLAAPVASEQEVERGSVLSFTAEKVEAVHPLRYDFVPLKDYAVKTGAFVADIRGGERLNQNLRDPLHAPTQLAVVDPFGNLSVQDQTEDLKLWQRFGKAETADRPAGRGARGASGEPPNLLDQQPARGERGGRRGGRRPNPEDD
jgi:hypothetical protein